MSISPLRAPVRPRVIAPETNEAIVLEEIVASSLEDNRCGAIELVGGPRTGKTTALAHLASLAWADRLRLVDDVITIPSSGVADRLLVYTTCRSLQLTRYSYRLAPWCDDDLIEYLQCRYPARCSSVMTRYQAAPDQGKLAGAPELYCLVADQMAASDSVQDLRTALRQAIAQRAGSDEVLKDLRFYAAAILLGEPDLAEQRLRRLRARNVAREVLGPLHSSWVRSLLTADRIVAMLKEGAQWPLPAYPIPPSVIAEVARVAAGEHVIQQRLSEIVNTDTKYVPAAASLLHALDPQWCPDSRVCSYLSAAYLPHAAWKQVQLPEVFMPRADLSSSDLCEANLEGSLLIATNFAASNLQRIRLASARASKAIFRGADLTEAEMMEGHFQGACFERARLDRVSAARADFRDADLRFACLRGAKLAGCQFSNAQLGGADFREADLRNANLACVALDQAQMDGADLSRSNLTDCDLEGVHWPGARLGHANLTGAYLTGSFLFRADLRGALLCNAGLADVDWEQVDLREADLRGASFHLGSTRSGLVGSPYPCHGSRTGYYTNDYDEQCYKRPEEIRKANLCGADLRGAIVTGVDFYLVDLRGAKYDRAQADHFRQCDAILCDHV